MFDSRREAGRQLGAALKDLRDEDPVVLALPRGGVPVAYEVASALNAKLDLVFVRKIGAPGYPELGLGAVVDGAEPHAVWNDEIVATVRPREEEVRAEIDRELAEIERRRAAYRGDLPPESVRGRTVVVVDDGIATGGTVRAVLEALARSGPQRVVLAIPVAAPDTLQRLRGLCDEVVCLLVPKRFGAVGAHYRVFEQTTDAEVVDLIARAEADIRAEEGRTVPENLGRNPFENETDQGSST